MATSKKHKILLPPLVLALTYLIWQIYLMLDPREHQPFQLPLSLHNNVTQNLFIDHSSPMHKQYHLLLQQYQITRLKRLIVEEQKAIAQAKQIIANIKHTTPNLPSDQELGLTMPPTSKGYALLYLENLDQHWAATISVDGKPYQIHTGDSLPDKTLVLKIDHNGVTLQHNKKNIDLVFVPPQQKTPNHLTLLELKPTKPTTQQIKSLQNQKHNHPKTPSTDIQQPHANNTLPLSPQETKSYHSLEKFIAAKKQASPTQLSEDEKWLLAVPPKDYTIQLYGARDLDAVQSFVKQYQLVKTHTFHSYYLNKPWFSLVMGKFKSYSNAITTLKHLPSALKKLKPWIRPMSSVHAAIKLYR